MAIRFSNNAQTTLASGITASATSITVANGSVFPTLTPGDHTYVTLEDLSGNLEIVKVTAISSNTLTVTRGQDGTTARAFSQGDFVQLRVTAALLNDLADESGYTLWADIDNVPSPVITLSGDASGSATMTELGNATLNVTVANDSHTHDSRYYTESEADTRFVNVTGDTMTGTLTVPEIKGGGGEVAFSRSAITTTTSTGETRLFSWTGDEGFVEFTLTNAGFYWHITANATDGILTVDSNYDGSSLQFDAVAVKYVSSEDRTYVVIVVYENTTWNYVIHSRTSKHVGNTLTKYTSTGSVGGSYISYPTAYIPSGTAYAHRTNESARFESASIGALSISTLNGGTAWRSNNDGSGSGLDADLLDGQHGSYYAPLSAPDFTGEVFTNASENSWAFRAVTGSTSNSSGLWFTGTTARLLLRDASGNIKTAIAANGTNSENIINGNTIWHAGNDGFGSGLDADLLDGVQGSSYLRSDQDDTLTGRLTFAESGYSISDDLHVWKRSYAVWSNSPKELLYHDGNSLPNGGAYRFHAHIAGTGTDQSATAVYWNENGTWKVNVTYQSGTSSNHPEFIIGSNGKPHISTDHPSTYTIEVLGERLELGEGTGTDNKSGFGADAYMSEVLGALRHNPNGGSDYTSGDRVFTDGYHPNADAWTTSRTITLAGDLSGSVTLDGSSNVTLTGAVANDSHNHTYFTSGGISDLNSVSNASNLTFRPFVSDFQATNRSGSNYNGGFQVGTGATNYGAQLVFEAQGVATPPKFRNLINGTWGSWYALWHNGNDGSGSGLDADLLDGVQGSSFLRSDANDTATGLITFSNTSDAQITLNGLNTSWAGIKWQDVNGYDYTWYNGDNSTFAFGGGGSNVAGKKLHVHGGLSVGSGAAATSTPTNGIYSEGEISVAGSTVYHTSNDGSLAKVVKGTVTGVNNSTYVTAFTVEGDNLASSIRCTFNGTSGGVVVNALVDLQVNHHQDILISSMAGFYTKLTIKVVSGNNEDYAVEIKHNGGTTTSLAVEVYPLNSETVTFATSHSYTGSTLEHVCEYGLAYSATGGSTANIKTDGTISAGAISASSVGVTNIVTNKVVKFNGTILDDSNITDTGSAITLGSNTTVSGTIGASGLATLSGGLSMSNTNIAFVNALSFADPGPGEGITWSGGNWSIWESPDDLTTNTGGNLQFVTSNSNRRMTVDTSGKLWTSHQGFVWGASNDGSGSGLDADTVDGIQAANIIYGSNSSGTNVYNYTDWNSIDKSGFYSDDAASNRWASAANWSSLIHVRLYSNNNNFASQLGFNTYDNRMFARTNNGGTWTGWDEIWHSGSDGSGSGLDADLLDGQQGSYYATASSLSSYVAKAGDTMTGNLTVNSANPLIKASATTTNWAGLELAAGGNQADYIFFKDDTAERARITVLDNNEMIFSQGSTPGTKMKLDTNGDLVVTNKVFATGLDIDHSSTMGVDIVATDSTADATFYAARIDHNASGSDALTGDRNHTGLYIDVDSSATGGDTSNEHRVFGIQTDVRATGDSDLMYGGSFYVESQHSEGTISAIHGIQTSAVADDTGTGHTANVYGVQALTYAYNSGSGGTSNLYALYGKTLLTGAADKNTNVACGVYGEVEVDTSGVATTLTAAYAFQAIIDQDATNTTITNSYLFKGDYTGTFQGTRWGIYIDDDVESLFGGLVSAKSFAASDISTYRRDIRSAGQIRATGWYNDAASTDYTGLGFEIGVSGSSTAYALSYNRDTDTYGAMEFNATGFKFVGTGNNPTLTLERYTGQPTIKAHTDDSGYLLMDSSGGMAGLNWYSSDRVVLANGGGNVGIGSSGNHSEKLYVSGSVRSTDKIVSGDLISADNRAAIAVAHWSNSGSSTGAVIIELPGTTSNYSMMVIEITTYEYNSNGSTTYTISGHNWSNTANAWYNNNCYVSGIDNKGISLGRDSASNRHIIQIGGASTAWNYGAVTVAVKNHPSYYDSAQDIGGSWNIYQTTNLSNINATSANTYRIWNAGIDGSGSGLDADVLDGLHATSFLRSDVSDSVNGDLTVNAGMTFNSNLKRGAHNSGHLEGSYNNVGANGSKTNPIYTIGSNYNPAETALSDMYGIGFARRDQTSYLGSFTGSGWGMYVAASGAAKIWLDAANGVIQSTGQHYAAGSVVWNAGNDGSGSGLDADTLDGYQASQLMHDEFMDDAYVNFTVDGDADTYYPVSIQGGGTFAYQTYSITRGYNWTAPSTWNTASHKGGLTLTWQFSGDGFWGGNDKDIRIIKFDETYSTMVMGMSGSVGGGGTHAGVVVWLRGGGATYRFYGPRGKQGSVNVHLTSVTASNGTVFSSRTFNASTRNSEIDPKYPIRDSSFLFDNNSRVWSAASDGSGSGLDADLLDGVHGSSFLRSDTSDSFTSGTLSFNSATALKMLAGSNFDASSGDVYVNLRVIRNAGTANTDGLYIGYSNSNSGATRIFGGGATSGGIYINGSGANDLKYNNASVLWHAGNDGSGSGLDADTLDGIQGSQFLRGDSDDVLTANIAAQGDFVGEGDGYRDHGVYGRYNSYRIHHMWSMGAAYRIDPNGGNFGNLYGFAYTYSNRVYTSNAMAGDHQIVWAINGTPKAALGANIWTAGNVTAYSDRAVKTNLEVIPDALSKVCQINGYTYDRTDFKPDPETGEMPNTRQAGVVAQEVEKVLPEVVSGEEGGKAVAYGNMVSLLIEAIKELKAEVDDLKAQLEEVK